MLEAEKAIGPTMSKVLLVDDDAALRAALEAALQTRGHVVHSAPDGIAALRVAIETQPDVIITDVNMPHLEGPDAVRILKSLPDLRRVPVILMSGAELPATGLSQAELRKPVDARRLLELVDDLSRPAFLASPAAHRAQPRTAAPSEAWDPALAAAALGAPGNNACAEYICRGIELMRLQAARLERLRRTGTNLDESERLFDGLVASIATLVQLLSTRAAITTFRDK